MDNGSAASVHLLRAQYSIDSTYEESREGHTPHHTPCHTCHQPMIKITDPTENCHLIVPLFYVDQSSSLFSIPGSYEFEMYRFTLCTHVHTHNMLKNFKPGT